LDISRPLTTPCSLEDIYGANELNVKLVDANHIISEGKKNGKVLYTANVVVSDDGKVMTITTEGKTESGQALKAVTESYKLRSNCRLTTGLALTCWPKSFHEKAGGCQGTLSLSSFRESVSIQPSRPVAILSFALFGERSSLGARWVFSFQ
jgi:hypothetical protein